MMGHTANHDNGLDILGEDKGDGVPGLERLGVEEVDDVHKSNTGENACRIADTTD